jgi:hypothetical protein
LIVATALLMIVAATIYLALHAAKTQPAEALRYDWTNVRFLDFPILRCGERQQKGDRRLTARSGHTFVLEARPRLDTVRRLTRMNLN